MGSEPRPREPECALGRASRHVRIPWVGRSAMEGLVVRLRRNYAIWRANAGTQGRVIPSQGEQWRAMGGEPNLARESR